MQPGTARHPTDPHYPSTSKHRNRNSEMCIYTLESYIIYAIHGTHNMCFNQCRVKS